jgi:hypothetical protein
MQKKKNKTEEKRNRELTRRLRYLDSPLSSAKFVKKSFARSVRGEREGLERRSEYARFRKKKRARS